MRWTSGRSHSSGSLPALVVWAAVAVCVFAVPAGAVDGSSPWRTLIAEPSSTNDLRPLDRFVVAWIRHDDAAMEAALEDDRWSPHLRHWARARVAVEREQFDVARDAYEHARDTWPATLEEPAAVQAVFDRDRLLLALTTRDEPSVRRILERPLRSHEDPVWDALAAWARWLEGDVDAALLGFDTAWDEASELDRRHPAFLQRALARLDAGDAEGAGRAWVEAIDSIRRPERQRRALELWETHPALHDAVRHAPDRRVLLRWLVRLFRRDEAEAIARRAYAEEADAVERAWLYVFVAEQCYRLRDHEGLRAWLDREQPSRLDDEQRAELEAYPLGVRRRSGHSIALAAAFDAVALRYPETDRATEALWEAAWMWELSGETETAIARYDEIRRRNPEGRWASASAIRSLWLRTRMDDTAGVRAVFDESRPHLRDGLDGAAGLWMRALADPEASDAWESTLREEHPFSPFWRPLAPPRRRDLVDSERVASELYDTQQKAFREIGEHLGLGAATRDELRGIERMAELGLAVEAETRLTAWARGRRSDTAAVAEAVRLAWRWGIPEVQGRYGWIVERRLVDEGDELARAARIVSMPTPFALDVIEQAQEAGLDPALVWALIRRESFYDADVISIAGAHGLMQLIERTGREMAEQRGHPEPSPYDLLAPPMNLELGIHYLAGLLDRAGDDRVRALASYNAGESNGRRWQDRREPGMGEAVGILVISYSETRDYVYHVTRHWNRYRALYSPTLAGP